MKKKRCINCIFYFNLHCHQKYEIDDNGNQLWPITDPDDQCDEFTERDDEVTP